MILLYELDGIQKSLDFPTEVKDISFGAFCDFRTLEKKYFDSITEEAGPATTIALLIDAISKFVIGDLGDLPFANHETEYQDLVAAKKLIEPGDELSLMSVYAHITVLIQSFKPVSIPTSFIFDYKVGTFVLEKGPAARVLKNKPLNTQEALECLEFQRASLEQEKSESHDVGNIDFTLGLTEVAILLRKKGEKLPDPGPKLDSFLEARRELFKSLPLDIVLAMRFFLLDGLLRYGQMKNTNFFGKAHQGKKAKTIRRKLLKRSLRR